MGLFTMLRAGLWHLDRLLQPAREFQDATPSEAGTRTRHGSDRTCM